MSRPEHTTTGAGRKEETWSDTIQEAITTTSNALRHAVDSIAGQTQGNTGSSATYSTSTGTSSAVESHPFVSGHSSTTGDYATGGTSDSNYGTTFGTTTSDKTSPATGVTGVPSTTSSAPNPTPGYNSSSTGSTTTGMNTQPHHTGIQYDSSGDNTGYTSSGPMGSYGHDSNLVEHNTNSGTTSARDPVTSRGQSSQNYSSQSHSSPSHSGQDSANQGQSTASQGRSTQDQTGTPTLTDRPSHTSNEHSDPSSNPSGPMQGGTDSSQLNSKDPSSSLPPPQTKGEGSATSRGDAPETTDKSASDRRQVNQGNSIGNTSDASSRLKGTQKSGPVSMSGEGTSHPGAGSTPAAGVGAPVGDPSSGQAPKEGKQGSDNPLQEPPKSKEDLEDEGTGQKYVKSSGVAAQGGDFDASKPGAGMEASRLLGKDGKPSTHEGHSTKPREPHEKNQFEEHKEKEKEEKPSLGEKIKGALHKG